MTTRKEERYLLSMSAVEQFREKIQPITSRKEVLTDFNHTVYFNHSEHEVPFEVSLKARRYDIKPFHGFLRLDEEWIFEIKEDVLLENSRMRRKERKNITLEEILRELAGRDRIGDCFISTPLRPFAADSYRRMHYHVNNEENFRITLDDSPTYFFFENGLDSVIIGKEDYCRVELKIPQDWLNSPEFYLIKGTLIELGAEPTISKKDMAYNFLSEYLRKKSAQNVPPSDTEIEAKLLLNRADQYVFHQIKKDFENNNIKGFRLLEGFSYTLEGAKMHKYLITLDGTSLRISTKGEAKKVVRKEGLEIINDPYGLNCILKRKEFKEVPTPNLSVSSEMILHRKRKYFLTENERTRNSYCILLDRCTHEDKELFQIEVEGLLLSQELNKEKEVIAELSEITNYLAKNYKCLKPSPLTKVDWLQKIKSSH